MAKSVLPLRPKGTYGQLSEEEKDCLTWYVLSGKSRMECFIQMLRQDLKRSSGAKQWCDQFFAVADVRNYIKEYEKTLKEYFNSKKEKKNIESIADETLTTFRNNVLNAVNQEGITDVSELADHAQLLNRAGYLKEKEEEYAPAQMYLPERCNSCRYKIFIDKQIEIGNIKEENN